MLKSVWFSTAIREGSTPPGTLTGAIADAFSAMAQQQPGVEALTAWGRSMLLECNPHGETGALALAQCSVVGAAAAQRHGAMS